ncbi:MAG: nitrogenase component 1 [Candidatus Omnitrophota bacterium]
MARKQKTIPFEKQADDSKFKCGGVSAYSGRWFYDRSFACGDSTKDLFRKLMNLSPNSPVLLDALFWEHDFFKIRLFDRQAKEYFLAAVGHYQKDKKGLYEKYRCAALPNGFVILSRDGALKAEAEKTLSCLAGNLGRIKPHVLFDTAYNDRNSFLKKRSRPEDLPGKAPGNCGLFDEWGDSRVGHTFMFSRSLLDRITQVKLSGDKSMSLRCGDVECNNMYYPFNFFDSFFMFNTYGRYVPIAEHIFRNDRGQLDARIRSGRLFKDIISCYGAIELKNEDVILGGDEKIYNFLDKLTRERKGLPVFVLCSCISKVIGSDLDSLVKRINRKNGARIICDQNIGCAWGQELVLNLLSGYLSDEKSREGHGKRINLVGFEKDHALEELTGLLRSFFGIELNMVFLPEVDLRSLGSYYNARLQVLNPVEIYAKAYRRVFRKMGIGSVEPPAPYGMKRSTAWIRSIAGFFKTRADKNKSWKEYYNRKLARWDELVREARKFRLGLVVGDEDAALLVSPEKYPFGIPLLKCLEEMGFGLNILFTSSEGFEENKKRIMDLFEHKGRHKVELLNDKQGLEKWIAGEGGDCIYSDIREDARIMSSGKSSFSLFIFERGIEGAVRTLEELLRLCRVSFFKRYKEYGKLKPHPIAIE